MSDHRALVTVVDDDESVREALPDLLREMGFSALAFESAEAFLDSDALGDTRCLLLDVTMPGMTGPDLQRTLDERGIAIPIIFITANADASVRASLLGRGAIACLFKPFSDEELRGAIARALSSSER